MPGACLRGDRFTCGTGCRTVGCHPAAPAWEETATARFDEIDASWRLRAWSVLLPTGRAFDVVDAPEYLGALAGPRGPVALTPEGRWMFFVLPGGVLDPDLVRHHKVVQHRAGSWVPAPPMPTPRGRIRWAVAPHETNWRLPRLESVESAMMAALPPKGGGRNMRTTA
jgi:hypothetical protein